MSREQVKDLIERALWTAAQTFIATWAVTNFRLDKTALIAAAASGLSALKTFVIQTI